MKALLALALIWCLSAASLASAETYRLGPENTSVRFISHWGPIRIVGRMPITSGTASESATEVIIDMTKMNAGQPAFTRQLLGPDFFDVQHFPTATFKSTRVEVTGKGTANITGDLTLHGLTRSIVMTVTYQTMDNDPSRLQPGSRISAVSHIRRSDFGLTHYRAFVSDMVELQIDTQIAE